LVPATWIVFQGNSTPFRRRAMRSRPGWIMAGGRRLSGRHGQRQAVGAVF
jgi:hypothetical protein